MNEQRENDGVVDGMSQRKSQDPRLRAEKKRWRDGSAAKSAYYPCKGPEFGSQRPQVGS